MVSVLHLNSDDLSSNPADLKNNFLQEKTKMYVKEAGVGPSFKKV